MLKARFLNDRASGPVSNAVRSPFHSQIPESQQPVGYLDIDFIPLSVFLHHVAGKGTFRPPPPLARTPTYSVQDHTHAAFPGHSADDVAAAARTYAAVLRAGASTGKQT